MDTLNAQVTELPKALRSLIRVGAYVKEVLEKADTNAQARAESGQQPNLLDDVMKDGQVHIANLEEVLTEIAGRTKAKTVVELMTHAHGLMGMYNSMSDMFGAGRDRAGEDAAGNARRAPAQAAHSTSNAPPRTGRFRPEFTSAARQAQAAPSAAPPPEAGQAQPSGVPAAHDAAATAPMTAATRPPTTSPGGSWEEAWTATLNAFKMDVARHLQAFEQAVAEEQAQLRGRMIQQSLEAAGIRAELRLIDPEHVPAASAPASTVEEHAAAQPAAAPVAKPVAEPAAAPVAKPVAEPVALAAEPVAKPVAAEPVVEPAAEPVAEPPVTAAEPVTEPAANRAPVEPEPHDDTRARFAAYAIGISNMINESHARVHASLTSDGAQRDAVDEELRELRNHVTRLRGSS